MAYNVKAYAKVQTSYQQLFIGARWEQIPNKPSSFVPTDHTHGNITDDGRIGTTANRVIVTTTAGKLAAKAAGTTSQFLRGDGAWATPPTVSTSSNYTWTGQHTFYNLQHFGLGFNAINPDNSETYNYVLPSKDGIIATKDDIPTTATTTEEGLVKLGGSQLTSNPTINLTTTSNRYYGVRTTSNGQMVVNVPWTNTTYSLMTTSDIDLGSSNIARTISAQRLKYAIETHAPSGGGSSEWIFEATIPHSAGQYYFSMDGYSEVYIIYSNASIAKLTQMEEVLYGPKEAFRGVAFPGYASSDILYVSSSDRLTLNWDPANYGNYKSHVHIYKR